MPGLSNRNPVAGYGNIGQVHIRYKPKPPPKSKYGAVIFIMCVFLFLFASCWTDPQRRYTFALPPLRMVMISFDKLRYLIYDPTSPKYDNFKVFYDNLGHPLIEGETTLDIVYGQGYTHAQHHLFQIDYLRQKAYGNLSQYEGQSRLSSDLLVRAVGLSELAENDLKYQSQMDMEILQRYADGINAYLSEKHPLPLEYTILGITEIQKWEPVHSLCVLRFFALQFSDSWETTLTKHILTQSMRKDSSSWVDLEDVSTSESASNSFTASASESWVLSGALTPNGKPILHTRIVSESSSLPLYVQNTLKTVSKNFHVAGISVLGVPLVLMGRNSDIAWTVSPISTAQNSNTIVVETLKKEPNCKDPDCVWYSRSDDGSWKPVESHLHEIQFRHWNKLSPTSNISNVSFVSIHTDNGLVMHEELFHVSWLAGKGQPGSDVAEYLVARIPSSDLNKSLRISSFLKINSASSWSEFSVALSSTLFPFDWQFLFASTTGDIARSVTGNSPSELLNPATGGIYITPELMVPNLVEKITQPRAISASLCNSSKSHSSSLLNRVTKRVSQLGLTQDEVSEILSLLDAVGEGNSRSFSLIHEIQASFVEELSPYLRAASLLLENSISPLRTLSSSVHLGVPSLIDELLAVSDNPESAILGPHLPLLTHSQIKDLLFSLGGPPRLQVRIDRAIIDGYAHFKEYGRQYTRFPHPLQAIEYSGEVLSLGPLPLPYDGSRCDMERWSGYRGSCLTSVHRALYDLASPSESYLATLPGASSHISSPFYASTLSLWKGCQDERLFWDLPSNPRHGEEL